MLDIITQIPSYIGQIIEYFKSFFEVIIIAIQFIPPPFLDITLMFSPIFTGAIIIKIVRGVL